GRTRVLVHDPCDLPPHGSPLGLVDVPEAVGVEALVVHGGDGSWSETRRSAASEVPRRTRSATPTTVVGTNQAAWRRTAKATASGRATPKSPSAEAASQ